MTTIRLVALLLKGSISQWVRSIWPILAANTRRLTAGPGAAGLKANALFGSPGLKVDITTVGSPPVRKVNLSTPKISLVTSRTTGSLAGCIATRDRTMNWSAGGLLRWWAAMTGSGTEV